MYRGETEKYRALLEEYYSYIRPMVFPFDEMGVDSMLSESIQNVRHFAGLKDILAELETERKKYQDRYKAQIEAAKPRERKIITNGLESGLAYFDYCTEIIKEAIWLTDKFGEGEYRDIPGLCKIAYKTEVDKPEDRDVSIEEKGWSLTPGAYVGVAPVEDDGVDFHERMAEIHAELKALQAQSNELMETISRNLEGMGI